MLRSNKKFHYADIVFLYATQILLFVIFISWINDLTEADKIPGLLRLALPGNDTDKDEFGKRFSGAGFLNECKKEGKKFTTVYLTGDIKEDEKRFDLIRYETLRIEYMCDTNTIVKVHFVEENTYGQFVALVNMMVEDHHKRYMYYKDDFYVLGEPFINSATN